MAGILHPGAVKRLEKKACCSAEASLAEKNERKRRLDKTKTKKVKPSKKAASPRVSYGAIS